MSAECHRCGADITYPVGTWPIGRCERCDLYEERDALRAENRRLSTMVAVARTWARALDREGIRWSPEMEFFFGEDEGIAPSSGASGATKDTDR